MENLVCYSSSDNSDEDQQNYSAQNIPYNKSSISSTRENNTLSKHKTTNRAETLLPLPDAIKLLDHSNYKKRKRLDDPNEHNGRIRSFDHVEGNWATHVYIPYDPDQRMRSIITEILACLRPLTFEEMEEFHISLSRTVTVRHHWIQSLTDALQKKFKGHPSTFCEIGGIKLLTNDEKTRTFLVMEVFSINSILQKFVGIVDECFAEFRLQKYYDPPSFHISIAWCLGDIVTKVTKEKLEKLQVIMQKAILEDADVKIVFVKSVECKTGNKVFHFPLEN